MREIKFRACLKEEYYSVLNPEKKIYDVENLDFDKNEAYLSECGWYDFDDIELMQNTGLKDKNGVKIFEGDIVKHIKGNTYTVEFYNGGFKLLRFNIYEGKPVSYHDFEVRILTEIEVIGNIYENKELLGRI